MPNEVKLLPWGVENFLSAIMAKTPNGEWITVQYHPNGDWSVAAEVASTNDDLAWLKGEVEHCRRMEYVTEAERYERIYNALLATRPTIVTDEVVERVARAIGVELPNLTNGTAIHLRLARAAIAAMPAIVGGE